MNREFQREPIVSNLCQFFFCAISGGKEDIKLISKQDNRNNWESVTFHISPSVPDMIMNIRFISVQM